MLKHIGKLLGLLLTAIIFILPGSAYADDNSDDPLAQYQDLINKARANPPKPAPANPAMNSGQGALRPLPATPAPMPNNQATVTPNTTTPTELTNSNSTNTSAANQPAAQQQTAPAGPPNIFITPGGSSDNSANKQGGSIIHY